MYPYPFLVPTFLLGEGKTYEVQKGLTKVGVYCRGGVVGREIDTEREKGGRGEGETNNEMEETAT